MQIYSSIQHKIIQYSLCWDIFRPKKMRQKKLCTICMASYWCGQNQWNFALSSVLCVVVQAHRNWYKNNETGTQLAQNSYRVELFRFNTVDFQTRLIISSKNMPCSSSVMTDATTKKKILQTCIFYCIHYLVTVVFEKEVVRRTSRRETEQNKRQGQSSVVFFFPKFKNASS